MRNSAWTGRPPNARLRATWREAESGRRRKYYALTPKGKRRLAGHRRQWRAVIRAMSSLGVVERAVR